MGHGGTLDPMATGVLILGVGNGTKSLNTFLECTKSYECVVLFGAATDTYDAVGKIVARKDYSHITKDIVEKASDQFRGKIMQKPPIFSALKVNGKKMYEYAREGRELPKEIEARPVEVKELEMVEWMDGGTHGFRWPEEDAEAKEKEVVDKVLRLGEQGADTSSGAKRKHDESDHEQAGIEPSPKRAKSSPESITSDALPNEATTDPVATVAEPSTTDPAQTPCPAPACRLRMTSTSGFYVRSLAHDLGAAVNSLGLMSSLVRTRQGDFELGTNVLDYDDLEKGEEVWGPKVEGMLKDWAGKEGEGGRRSQSPVRGEGGHGKGYGGEKAKRKSDPKKLKEREERRRNTSSEDSG